MKKFYFKRKFYLKAILLAWLIAFSYLSVKSQSSPIITTTPDTMVACDSTYTYNIVSTIEDGLATTFSTPILPGWLTLIPGGSATATQIGSIPANVKINGVAGDDAGNIYAITSNGTTIYRITADGTTTVWASGLVSAFNVNDFHIANGYIYMAKYTKGVYRISLDDPMSEVSWGGSFPYGAFALANKDDSIYVSTEYKLSFFDPSTPEVYKIDTLTEARESYLSTTVGLPEQPPIGMTFGSDGNLYVATNTNGKILKYDGTSFTEVLTGLGTVTDIEQDASGSFYVAIKNVGIRKYTNDFLSYVVLSGGTAINDWRLGTASGSLIYVKYGTNEVYMIQATATLSGTPTTADVGVHSVVLRVTNNNGFSEQSFNITVIDTVPPEISCNPIEVALYKNGKYVLTYMDIASMVESVENNLILTASPRSFECIHVGTAVPVKVTASDTQGNETSCWTTVTVYDTIAPVAVCKDITISLDENGEAYIFQNQVDGGSYDACGIDKLALNKQQFNCGDIGVNAVTLKATDPSGNTSTCTAHVTIVDDQAPLVEPVSDIEISVEPGVCETAVDYPELVATDNCETTAELTSGLGTDGMFPVGTTTETWTVTDEGGNIATVSFNVVITTTNAVPTIDSVADITVDEDTATIMVPLSGISYGIDCASQDVVVTATTDNPDLITSLMVNYIDGPTGSVELTVAPNTSGTATIALLVTDSEGGEVADTFMVTVTPVNDPPFVVNPIADQAVNASYELKIPVSSELGVLFDDVDDTSLTITAMAEGTDTLPGWTMLSGDTLYVTPMIADTGCVNIVVMATDAAGATASDTFEVCVDGYPVSISEIGAGEFEVTMYPNPTRGEVNLDFGSGGIYDVELSVMDITGRLVLQKQYSAQQTIRFDMSDKVSGMYFVHLNLDGIQVIKKLVVNRK